MARGLVTISLTAALIAIGASPASAAFVPGCANPDNSALNQYCEVIPSATGAHPPKAGEPATGANLPPQIVRQIQSGPAAQRALLHMPAAHRTLTGGAAGVQTTQVAKASASGLPGWLIALLAALVLVMVVAAAAQRRRGRAGPAGEPPA
jgi:hypothetical protein